MRLFTRRQQVAPVPRTYPCAMPLCERLLTGGDWCDEHQPDEGQHVTVTNALNNYQGRVNTRCLRCGAGDPERLKAPCPGDTYWWADTD